MSGEKDESASCLTSSPKSFPRPSASATGLREATIPESPESEEVMATKDSPSPRPAVVPPEVPRRNRAMSSAHLTQFLGSTASAARRSLALRPAPAMPTVTPQFLTVSPAFQVRDQSRSPSPSSPAYRRSGPRHSVDVRNFPSYLQRKRTSLTLGAAKILDNLTQGTVLFPLLFLHPSSPVLL